MRSVRLKPASGGRGPRRAAGAPRHLLSRAPPSPAQSPQPSAGGVFMSKDPCTCRDPGPGPVRVAGARCRENMAHTRQSSSESGLDFQVKVPNPSSLGSGVCCREHHRPHPDRLHLVLGVSSHSSHRNRVKSLGSSYTGLYPQRVRARCRENTAHIR